MKKAILILLLSLLAGLAFAQPDGVFRIDSLPPEGILLDQDWKWHAGDDPEWAKPDYDDAGWESVDPSKDIHELPHLFNAQVKWLRLTFEVTNKLPQPLGLSINQAGASEIYLNGQLLQRIGHIDRDSSKVKAVDPLEFPIYFPLDTIGKYHLAIRYSLQPNISYSRLYAWTQNRLFAASLVDLMAVQKWHREFRVYYTGLEVFKIGVLLMLFVLHLSFYFYQKTSKTHLFLAIYFIGGLGQYVFKIMGQNQFLVEDRYFSLNLSACCTSLGQLFALAAFYQLAKVRLDKYYLLAIIAVFTQLATSTLVYGMLWGTMALINALLLVIVMLRLTFIGLKKKIDGFYILGVAVFISSLGFVVIELLNRNFLIHPYVVDLVFNLSALAVPVGLSLYMGIEASERNKSLSAKLIENEILKNQSIASEQEKQQILASQNETLERQVAERTAALKASQSQLIQSEKLASLGELTAGIAHEIQNPLNFVNNFAEVSAEMIDELTEELVKGDTSEAQAIAQDLKGNLEKINHHGQRASGIVKSMLEHSRTSSGTKEPTNLNALADEYLRLAYHGLRAKDSSFNAEYELMADPDLPLVNVVPQDMGRVLLNLINNAFYVVAERSRSAVNERAQQGIIGYQPKVTIQTRWLSHAEAPDKGQIEIRVKDNGSGIPEAIREKIFQPFFTTKPTGQGTGLGLSLAYDIVTKGHGGKLELESEEGVGTTFVIQLPVNG